MQRYAESPKKGQHMQNLSCIFLSGPSYGAMDQEPIALDSPKTWPSFALCARRSPHPIVVYPYENEHSIANCHISRAVSATTNK
eukprot:scaffold63586_cov32-Tisochrysis_lutea.AAC.5